jgi:hypothetical protein
MAEHRKWIGILVAFAAFGAAVGYFSASPRYRHLAPGQAMIRLSVSQPGQPVGDCRTLTGQELAARAPNMRKAEECPRERSPLSIRLTVDGTVLYDEAIAPTGLRRDGSSAVYRRFQVAAGSHRIEAALSDDARVAAYPFTRAATVTLEPGQVLTVDFDRAEGGIVFL